MAGETSVAFNSSPSTSARYAYIITDKARNDKIFICNAEEDVTILNLPAEEGGGSQVFESVPVAHSGYKRTQEFENAGVRVMFPKNDGNLGTLFLSSITAEIRIKILRISSYANNPTNLDYADDIYVVTEGVVTNISFNDQFAQAELIPEAYAQNFSVPRFWFTRTCNHPLFSEGCGVDKTAYQLDATVTALDRTERKITIGGQSQTESHWTYGTISHDNTLVQVSIIKCEFVGADMVFTVINWLPAIEVGNGVRLLPGCRRIPEDCRNKFNNAANFGGFDRIPTRDSAKHGV